jgi:hypothetical protein
MVRPEERVNIWNSYFCESHNFAKKLKKSKKLDCPRLEGETLTLEQHYSLMTMVHLTLAVEARANHLLHELAEKGIISKTKRDEIRKVNGKERWALLPTLVGKDKISYNDDPHDVIKEIFKFRNRFIHVRFHEDEFISDIPDKDKALHCYNRFIYAMANMNEIIREEKSETGYLKNLEV